MSSRREQSTTRTPGEAPPVAGRTATVWRSIGVLTTLLVLIVVGTAAWGQLARRSSRLDTSYARSIGTLAVDSSSASVRISAGAVDQVIVHQKLDWTLQRPEVKQVWQGDTLRIVVRCDRWPYPGGPGCRADLDIVVPAAVAVSVTSTSGSTEVRGLSGDLGLRTGSGGIDLIGVRGKVQAKSHSGGIVGRRLAAPELEAVSTSGPLDLDFASAPRRVDAASNSGGVDIQVPNGSTYRIGGHSSSGSRTVAPGLQDSGSALSIDVTSSSGSVAVGYPAQG